MKKIMVLAGDYWHPLKAVEPLLAQLFQAEERGVVVTEDPRVFLEDSYALLLSFKSPVEDNRIPTPSWCTEEWTDRLLDRISSGMGYIAVHSALTALPKSHRIVRELHEATFVRHPERCPVTFLPRKDHPILKGIGSFRFAENDEQYVMDLLPDRKAEILADSISEHGAQPALWVREDGRGKACMAAPGHDSGCLTDARYRALLQNAIAWCLPTASCDIQEKQEKSAQ